MLGATLCSQRQVLQFCFVLFCFLSTTVKLFFFLVSRVAKVRLASGLSELIYCLKPSSLWSWSFEGYCGGILPFIGFACEYKISCPSKHLRKCLAFRFTILLFNWFFFNPWSSALSSHGRCGSVVLLWFVLFNFHCPDSGPGLQLFPILVLYFSFLSLPFSAQLFISLPFSAQLFLPPPLIYSFIFHWTTWSVPCGNKVGCSLLAFRCIKTNKQKWAITFLMLSLSSLGKELGSG